MGKSYIKRILQLFVFFYSILAVPVCFAQLPGSKEYNQQHLKKHDGNPTVQDGSGSLGNTVNLTKCGLNFVQSSVLLGQRMAPGGVPYTGVIQPAPFAVTGIPCFGGIHIEKAYLWLGTSGNGVPVNATIQNPQNTSAVFSAALIGSGADKCWGYAGSHTYRADVTNIITGNGTYLISGLPTGAPNDVDGAALFIIYTDSSATYTGNLLINDGTIIVSNGGALSQTITGFSACQASSTASAFMIAADLQGLGASMSMNGGPGAGIVEDFWDYEQRPANVTNGQTTSTFGINSPNDCYNWLLMGLYYQTPGWRECPTRACY